MSGVSKTQTKIWCDLSTVPGPLYSTVTFSWPVSGAAARSGAMAQTATAASATRDFLTTDMAIPSDDGAPGFAAAEPEYLNSCGAS